MKIINLNSELHIDNEVDAAYLYLSKDNLDKNVLYTSCLLDNDTGVNINVDYSSDGKVIGLEFIPSSSFFKY